MRRMTQTRSLPQLVESDEFERPHHHNDLK